MQVASGFNSNAARDLNTIRKDVRTDLVRRETQKRRNLESRAL